MAEGSETETCEECRQPSIQKCQECGMRYCACCDEQDHWSKCKSFEVCCSEKSGFYLRATRNLFAGEIIFSELPLLYGPKLPIEDGRIPCVGCCRTVSSDKILRCPECLWPACSPNCEGLKDDCRHGLECKILKLQRSTASDISAKDFRFEILLPLKFLFLQTTHKPEWDNLLKQIEDNCDKVDSNMNDLPVKCSDTIKFLEENYLTPLEKSGQSTGTTILEQKSLNVLDKVLSLLKTTKHKPAEDISIEILYPAFSLIEHNCVPNSLQIIENTSNQFKITVRANSFITKNTNITSSLTDPFQGTCERLADLKTSNSSCSCSRCTDPTEFDTFFSALKCLGTRKNPCGGTQLPKDPTNSETVWICDKCKIELPNDQMVKFVQHLGGEVGKVLAKSPTVDELEEFLAKLLMFLHPNHFHVCAIKHALVKSYGEDSLLAKIDICQSLLDVARKLCPNSGSQLAELLLELFQAKISFLKLNYNEDNKSGSGDNIEELKKVCAELRKNVYLRFDPKLRQILTDEETKLDSWLHQMSIT